MIEALEEPIEAREPTPSELTKSVYIRRSNGEISVMRMAEDGQKDEHGPSFAYAVEADEDDGTEYVTGKKPIAERNLTDEMQAVYAQEYALTHPDLVETSKDSEDSNVELLRQHVSQELGEDALEAAAINYPSDDPSVIDESASYISASDMRAMREASRRIVNVPVMESVPEQSTEHAEKNPHRAKLFAPPVRPEVPQSGVNLMDAYFSKEDGVYEDALEAQLRKDKDNEPIVKAQKDFDRVTNQETREYSEQQLAGLLRHDAGMRELLAAQGFTEASLEAVDAIREDPELRYSVGEYFITKLDTLVTADINAHENNFGDRLKRNGQKNNDYIALAVSTSSREYAAYLALAKVSGMFNYKDDTSDIFADQNDKGIIVLNQHRHAADMLL